MGPEMLWMRGDQVWIDTRSIEERCAFTKSQFCDLFEGSRGRSPSVFDWTMRDRINQDQWGVRFCNIGGDKGRLPVLHVYFDSPFQSAGLLYAHICIVFGNSFW